MDRWIKAGVIAQIGCLILEGWATLGGPHFHGGAAVTPSTLGTIALISCSLLWITGIWLLKRTPKQVSDKELKRLTPAAASGKTETTWNQAQVERMNEELQKIQLEKAEAERQAARMKYLEYQVEEKTTALRSLTTEKTELEKKLAAHQECISPTKHKALTLEKSNYWQVPSDTEYSHRLLFAITNTSGWEIDIWSPLWEASEGVQVHPPLASFLAEDTTLPDGGMGGPTPWGENKPCLRLRAGQKAWGWIGLLPPAGEGLQIRIPKGQTGHLIFALKINGKLKYEKVKV